MTTYWALHPHRHFLWECTEHTRTPDRPPHPDVDPPTGAKHLVQGYDVPAAVKHLREKHPGAKIVCCFRGHWGWCA